MLECCIPRGEDCVSMPGLEQVNHDFAANRNNSFVVDSPSCSNPHRVISSTRSSSSLFELDEQGTYAYASFPFSVDYLYFALFSLVSFRLLAVPEHTTTIPPLTQKVAPLETIRVNAILIQIIIATVLSS
jgi:hypothetical protein